MPRTVKKSIKNSENDTLEPERDETAPLVRETHRVVKTWDVKKPLDDAGDEIAEYEEEVEEETQEEIKPRDPIEALLDEIGASHASWAMHVNRLPKYARDERTDPKSRVFAGTLTIPDENYLREEKYKEDIQERFAKGTETNHFYCCVRRDNRNYCYLPVVSVEPPDPATIAQKQIENSGQPINIFQTPQTAEDGFNTFVKQARQFAQLRELLFPTAMLENFQPPAAKVNEPLTTERALMHLVAQDGEVIDTFLGKLKGVLRRSDTGHEIGWMDLVFEAIKSDTLPKMIREAKQLLVEANGQHPAIAPLSPIDNNAGLTGPPVAQPQQQAQSPEIQLLNFVIQAYLQNWTPKATADWIAEFENQNAGVQPYVTAFLGMDPDEALSWLSQTIPQAQQIAQLPSAKKWFADLQAELKYEEPAEEITESNDA